MVRPVAALRPIARLIKFTLAAIIAPAAAQDLSTDPPRIAPFVVFFPSLPPPYGAPISGATSTSTTTINGKPLVTPEDLADFVGEIFYPALGSRLHDKSLGKKLEARLDAYRETRGALLNELTDKLAAVQNLDAATRERELLALAPQQSPRILALEQEAEQLRQDLIRGGFLSSSVEWNLSRAWRLGEAAVATNPTKADAEFQVARAAAFYEPGLGIEQRGLLRELAVEFMWTARKSRGRPTSNDDLTAMFFSPETARMSLSASRLPPELLTKIGRFNRDKTTLKLELFATLTEADKVTDNKRKKRLIALTEKQWPQIVALEAQAEEIRRDLATVANAPPPWLPPISPALRQRIDGYATDRNQLIADQAAALRNARGSERFDPSIFRLPPAARERVLRERAQKAQDAERAAAAEFLRQNAERIDELQQRYETIRADLVLVARDLKDPKSGQPMTVESLLVAYNVSNRYFAAIGREEAMYTNYKAAMLQPGLSPPQRRLLFTAAHAALAQPLPGGEYVSSSPQSRPRPAGY